MENKILNLLNVCRKGSRALGPGVRYVIWTQGCPFHCKGCTTPEGQPIIERQMVDVELMAKDIIKRKNIDGITISGGEPFLQASSLAYLIRLVRIARPDINVIVFTGFLIEALSSPEAKALLSEVDVLIDGQFDERKKTSKGLRGSTNQRIHFITNRLLTNEEDLRYGKRIFETKITNDTIITIGIPT